MRQKEQRIRIKQLRARERERERERERDWRTHRRLDYFHDAVNMMRRNTLFTYDETFGSWRGVSHLTRRSKKDKEGGRKKRASGGSDIRNDEGIGEKQKTKRKQRVKKDTEEKERKKER